MSRENVEIVRGIYGALARWDAAAAFRSYADDIVWDVSNMRVGALTRKPVYVGHDGVRDWWRESLEIFGKVHVDVEELVDAGDQVLAFVRERHVGRSSAATVEAAHMAVWTLANGKVVRLRMFEDRQQALEAAGLGE